VLVFHYTHSDNHAKQREYLRKAAQAAQAASAFITTVEYLARLLDLAPADDPARFALALQLAEAHLRLSDYPAARDAIAQAQTAAQTEADRASALALLGEIANELGDYAEAQTVLAQAVPLAQASGDGLALCRALYAQGDAHWRLGNWAEARAVLNESLALARALGDVSRELFALNRLGSVAIQEDVDEADRCFTEVYTRALVTGNRERMMNALNNLGVVAFRRQTYATAQDNYRQALTLAREVGAQEMVAFMLNNLADVAIKLGQLPAARADLHEGLRLSLRLGAPARIAAIVFTCALLARAEGQTARALTLVGLVRRQPSSSNPGFQRYLDMALAKWGLDPSVVAAGLATGAELDWDATIQELLKE
jgi:tetratricopeptide (TPR) repeat protein